MRAATNRPLVWREARGAFSLIEVLLSIAIIALVGVGMIYGYVQTNDYAKWSSMSLAAQSIAAQGLERARAARWVTYGNSVVDDLPAPATLTETDSMLVPGTGQAIAVTNTVVITTVVTNPPVRQLWSQCVWQFPFTGQWFTNTVVTCRSAN